MTFVNYLKGYALTFTNSAQKDLEQIDPQNRKIIDKKLTQLISGHPGLDIKKLVNYQRPTYRLRVGMYRVIYEVYDDKIVIVVIGIDHRKDAYK